VTRLLLMGSPLLTLLLAFGIGAMRVLPAPDPDTAGFERLFQTSDECDTPCLLGIRPGIPLAEAMTLLRAHDWISGVTVPNTFLPELYVYWNWSGRQPDFIDTSVPGQLFARSDTDDTGHYVIEVAVMTRLRFHELQRALGTPNGAWHLPVTDHITYGISYHNVGQSDDLLRTTVIMELPCPARPIQYYWHNRTRISQNRGRTVSRTVSPQNLWRLCRA